MPDVGCEQGSARKYHGNDRLLRHQTQPQQRDAGKEHRQSRTDHQKASEIEAFRRFLTHVRDVARDERDTVRGQPEC